MKAKVIIIALLIGTLLACGGGGGNNSGEKLSPSLVSITLTPTNPSVAAGNTQQFTATGTYSDNSTKDLTSAATWTTSNAEIATIDSAGLASAVSAGTATIMATSGGVSGKLALTVTPLSLTLVRKVTLTTDTEGGSARPEVIVTEDRVFVLYLGHIREMSARTFDLKIYDWDMTTIIAAKTIVSPTTEFGSPTDMRVASDGQYLYAFYETTTAATTFLHGAKYHFNDTCDLAASALSPIASSKPVFSLTEGDEVLNDPAPLVGQDSVFVITRIWSSISTTGKTIYRVREFSKDTMAQKQQFDLDLSGIADGRGRVTSLLYENGTIYMAFATTVSDQGMNETTKFSDDGAQSDILLVKMKPDWTFDPASDVQTISSETGDRENYIAGLKADGTYFYMTYKQAIGSPPTGQQRAVIKIFDRGFNLLLKQIVKSSPWGTDGGEIRPSLEAQGTRIYSGQDNSQGIGTGNGEIYIYEKK